MSKQIPVKSVYVPPKPNALIILSRTPVNNAANQHLIKLTHEADAPLCLGYKSTNIVVQIDIMTEAEKEIKMVEMIIDIIGFIFETPTKC